MGHVNFTVHLLVLNGSQTVINPQTNKQTNILTDKKLHTESQTDWMTDRQTDRQANRQTDKIGQKMLVHFLWTWTLLNVHGYLYIPSMTYLLPHLLKSIGIETSAIRLSWKSLLLVTRGVGVIISAKSGKK